MYTYCAMTLIFVCILFVMPGCFQSDVPDRMPVSPDRIVEHSLAKIAACVDCIENIDRHELLVWAVDLKRELLTQSNKVVKAKLLGAMMDRLLAVDVSRLKYKQQLRAIDLVHGLVDECCVYVLPELTNTNASARLEQEYDNQIRFLTWQRDQILRTSPTHKRDKAIVLSEDEQYELSAWRQIHYGGIARYEAKIRTMESRLPYRRRQVTEEVYARIVAKIEAYLGRRIRTAEELRHDGKTKRWVQFPNEHDDILNAP